MAHEDLYPLIIPEVLGAPTMSVDLAINKAAWEFCQDSLAWQVDLDPITVRAGKDIYDLELTCDALLVVMTSVKLDGREQAGICTGKQGQNSSATGHQAPLSWVEVQLFQTPAQAGSLSVRVALKPKMTSDNLPCILTERYCDVLAEGAKAQLKRMTNKAWSDPQGAVACYQMFRRLTNEARISAEVERTRGPLRVTPLRFGA